MYLAPESEKKRKKRLRMGGNRKINYTEGWVEFLDKRVAKAVGNSLNNEPMGVFVHLCCEHMLYCAPTSDLPTPLVLYWKPMLS